MMYLQQGGWLMWPILIASILALAIILERLWMLRRSKILPRDVRDQAESIAQLSPAQAAAFEDRGVLGQLLSQAVMAGQGRDQRQASLAGNSAVVVRQLERHLELLGVIAAVAPLMGLLGTVIGMIDVFGALMIHGAGDASQLAGGISQALVTTASGLLVAIPALIGHRLLLRRARHLLHEIEGCCERFLSVPAGVVASHRQAA